MSVTIFIIVCLSFLLLVLWGICRSKDKELKLLREFVAREGARPDHEHQLLSEGLNESWMQQHPRDIARSAGNVVYLVWLLRVEATHRDFRGVGGNQYPPDWKWRKSFALIRDSFMCRECQIGIGEGLPLDCHHIVPISEWPQGKPGIHGLNNIATLCPMCHAKKHPENNSLQERAKELEKQAIEWRQSRTEPQSRNNRLGRRSWPLPVRLEDLLNSAPVSIPVAQPDYRQADSQDRSWPELSEEQQQATITEFHRLQSEKQAGALPLGPLPELEELVQGSPEDQAKNAGEAFRRAGKAMKDNPKLQVPY
jgi:5-methylcytosine-specific restriction endonuclease McrA